MRKCDGWAIFNRGSRSGAVQSCSCRAVRLVLFSLSVNCTKILEEGAQYVRNNPWNLRMLKYIIHKSKGHLCFFSRFKLNHLSMN